MIHLQENNRQISHREQYERQAIKEGAAVRTPHSGVLHVFIAGLMATAAARASELLSVKRTRAGLLGANRTPRANARATYRKLPAKKKKALSFKAWLSAN